MADALPFFISFSPAAASTIVTWNMSLTSFWSKAPIRNLEASPLSLSTSSSLIGGSLVSPPEPGSKIAPIRAVMASGMTRNRMVAMGALRRRLRSLRMISVVRLNRVGSGRSS